MITLLVDVIVMVALSLSIQWLRPPGRVQEPRLYTTERQYCCEARALQFQPHDEAADSSRPPGPRPETADAALPDRKLEKPGLEADMQLRPRWTAPRYRPAGKLEGKVAIVTGGDSGIGRAVAYLFALEGADVALTHLVDEREDADATRAAVEQLGRRCIALAGDLQRPDFCREVVERTVADLGRLDILVSNAAWQNRKAKIEEVSDEEWHRTLRTNLDAYFYLSRAAAPHMAPGSAIIATASEVGLLGSESLLDYGASKGGIIAFTKSLAQQLAERGIRVNAVAPGPVWTPLNPADEGASPEKIANFGKKTPLGRAAQPEEIAPAYVFLASDADSSYITGIVLAEMGGITT